jgi:PKD repeat protein
LILSFNIPSLKKYTMKIYLKFNFVLSLVVLVIVLLISCKKDKIVTSDFTITQSTNCTAPCEVCFTNTSQNAERYQWNFGNGQISTEISPCFTYTERGTYTVTLNAIVGTQTIVQTKQVIVAFDNIARFKEVFPYPNQPGRNILVTPNGYIYAHISNANQFIIKQYGPYNSIIGLPSTYEQSYNNDIGITDLVLDNDNGILLVGSVGSGKAGLRKYKNFELIFDYAHNYQDIAPVSALSVTPGNNGGYVIVGSKAAWGGTPDPVGTYTLKIDKFGNKLNEGVFEISPSLPGYLKKDVIKRIFRNPDPFDPYIGIGEWVDPIQEKKDIFISRITNDGLVSTTTGSDIIGLDNNEDDFVNDAVQFEGNKYAIVGKYNGNVSFMTFAYNDGLVMNRFDLVKNFPSLLYLTSICSLENTQGYPAQGFGVCGVTTDLKIFVAKLDINGEVIWQRTYGDAGFLTIPDIAYTFWDGGFVVIGTETCPNTPNCVGMPFVMKTDRNGEIN